MAMKTVTPPHMVNAANATTYKSVRICSTTIDISCPQGAQQQTRQPPLLLSIDGKDRRTDGHRTVTYRVDPASSILLCGQHQ